MVILSAEQHAELQPGTRRGAALAAHQSTVRVAALPSMTPPGRSVALDLLSRISAAEITGPPHEQIGKVDVEEIRQAVAGGFPHYIAVLRAETSPAADLYSCVDLMGILAFHDRSMAAEATAALTLERFRLARRQPASWRPRGKADQPA